MSDSTTELLKVNLKGLPAGFDYPENWKWDLLSRPEPSIAGKKTCNLRYGFLDTPPELGYIAIFPGFREPAEKYLSLINELIDQGYTPWILEPINHGLSTRLANDPQKMHTNGYEKEVADYVHFLSKIPEDGKPLHIIAHSRSGLMVQKLLADHESLVTNRVSSVCLSSPLVRPRLPLLPDKFISNLLAVTLPFGKKRGIGPDPKSYAPFQSNWKYRSDRQISKLTTDVHGLGQVQDILMKNNPQLRMGGITFGHLQEMLRQTDNFLRSKQAQKISTPIALFHTLDDPVVKGFEELKDNAAKNYQFYRIPDAGHELLMETDSIRNHIINDILDHFANNAPKPKNGKEPPNLGFG